jgi:hypothetical protein
MCTRKSIDDDLFGKPVFSSPDREQTPNFVDNLRGRGKKCTLQKWGGGDSLIGSCDPGDLESHLVAQELVEPRDDFRAESTGPIGFVQYDHITRSASDSRLQSIIVQGAEPAKIEHAYVHSAFRQLPGCL